MGREYIRCVLIVVVLIVVVVTVIVTIVITRVKPRTTVYLRGFHYVC
jgi:hypothetical protein